MDWNYQVGNFICQRRKEKGLTQKQLGEKLGVSNKAVSKWENGSSVPRVNLIPKLSELLHCTQEELFLGYQASANPLSSKKSFLFDEYVTVVKRCDCCRHRPHIRFHGPMTCELCGATIEPTMKTRIIENILCVSVFYVLFFATSVLFFDLTRGVLSGAYPTAEEARISSEFLKAFPETKLLAYFLALLYFKTL